MACCPATLKIDEPTLAGLSVGTLSGPMVPLWTLRFARLGRATTTRLLAVL